ncbi:MAG TPA: NHLP bacteriocin system secretion protein [Longimicrobiales bacterium]|nr:NHLP bacteriocin system secretion protein [Longimicrobiales bacterium]
MARDTSIFRKSALERLQSPERLDHLMQVTTPRGWIALVALSIVVVAGLLWGFLGSTPEQVQVTGIMLREGGIFEIHALESGQVEALLLAPGEPVREGDVVAHVAQPQMARRVTTLEDQVVRLQAHRDSVAGRLDVTTRIELDGIAQQREQAQASRAAARAQVEYLRQRAEAEERALERGLITPDILQGTRSQLASAEDQVTAAEVLLSGLEGQVVTTRSTASDQVYTLDQQLADLHAQPDDAREQYEAARNVTSPFTGLILEELVDIGETVSAGGAVYAMEIDTHPLDIYLFTPEGKRVAADMQVQLVPAGVVPEEDGYLLGTVEKVSPSPLGTQAMNRYLRNQTLVQAFEGTTGAYLVEVLPWSDSTTTSGFAWTTGSGPDLELGSGALLSGNVIVEVRRPITLVIPALRRWLGGGAG